jgi:hypothetical protein
MFLSLHAPLSAKPTSSLPPKLFAHAAGNADPAGLRQRRQPHCYVDGDAPNIRTVGDDVADIDAQPELGTHVQRGCIALEHCALNVDGAAHRGYRAFKFHEQRMACHPPSAAAVFQYSRLDQLLPLCDPHGRRASSARHDEPAVADDIGCEHGHEPPLYLLAGQTGPSAIAWGMPANARLRPRTPDRCGVATAQRPPLGRTKHCIVPASMKR